MMERGDIYLVNLNPVQGHGQAGERRVLVISHPDFNRVTGLPIVVPITTGGDHARTKGFAVSLTGSGLMTQGVVLCNQMRALDLRARKARRLETAPAFIVDEVLAKIGTIFE
jgi:mRNA-degrading endonuclease toxin of MazEF toxin-antitoxin module